MVATEREQGRPIATRIAPPVPGARLFLVHKVRVEFPQLLAHRPGLLDRHIVVAITVQDVDPLRSQILNAGQCVAGQQGATQHLRNRIIGQTGWASGIAAEADPTGTRSERRKPIGKERSDMPGPMATHGMARQIRSLRIGVKTRAGLLQHFQCIPPSPIFPIETERASIGGRDHVRVGFRSVHGRLTFPLDPRAM